MPKLFKLHGGNNASWFFRVTDESGKRVRVCTYTTDKRLAESIKSEHLARIARIKSGVANAGDYRRAERARISISTEIESWEAGLRSRGDSDRHISDSTKYVREAAEFANWKTVGDLDEDDLVRWLSTFKASGMAARSIQKRGRSLRQFATWLFSGDKTPTDLFKRVQLPNPEIDRRHVRRMLLPDEWIWLCAWLDRCDRDKFGLAPHERKQLYDFAIQTGFRSSEIRAIKRCDLTIDSISFVELGAEFTKNKKAAKQFVRTELARLIGSSKIGEAPLLRMPRADDVAGMLRWDVARARSWWLTFKQDASSDFLLGRNAQGQVLDFHALRHTCGAWLALAGRQPKEIQEIMRHSSIVVTLDTYGHLLPNSVQDAVQAQGEWLNRVAKCGPSNGHLLAFLGT